ncbi:MAG: sulfatase-like hydrolase/transferase [Planctomycetes bacterium]|nr:sulfatase-like hydrolase/transferase [Planctomycetota bacterium]
MKTAWSLLALFVLGSCGGDGELGTQTSSDLPLVGKGLPVILVSLDTCRSDRLGFAGARNPNSPALDKLAKESVVFTDCLSQSSNTGPSHRSLFTGMFPTRHKHQKGVYVRSPFTMAGELKGAGYETAAFTGGGFLSKDLGFGDGFDTFVDQDQSFYETGDDGSHMRRGLHSILPQLGDWMSSGGPQARPFFLFLHTYDIHCPYWPTEEFRSRYGEWYEGNLDLKNLCGQSSFQEFLEGRPAAEDINYLNAMYDAGVAMTDQMMGLFLGNLQASGILDKAILIVTSDHGESLGERPYIGHNAMWEEQLKVPLMVRFPGGEFGGTTLPDPVMLVDVLPTVLDFLGLDQPEGIQGESLMPLVEGRASYGSNRFRLAHYQNQLSFRYDQRWKVVLIQEEEQRAKAKLYDLLADPFERKNLLAQENAEESRAVLDGLIERFQAWREEARLLDEKLAPERIEGAISEDLARELEALGYSDFAAE